MIRREREQRGPGLAKRAVERLLQMDDLHAQLAQAVGRLAEQPLSLIHI